MRIGNREAWATPFLINRREISYPSVFFKSADSTKATRLVTVHSSPPLFCRGLFREHVSERKEG